MNKNKWGNILDCIQKYTFFKWHNQHRRQGHWAKYNKIYILYSMLMAEK